MGDEHPVSRGGIGDLERTYERVLTGKITKKAAIHAIIDGLGGLAAWANLFARSYEACKPGTAARATLDRAILSAIQTLEEEDDAPAFDNFEEMEAAVQAILAEKAGADDGDMDPREA